MFDVGGLPLQLERHLRPGRRASPSLAGKTAYEPMLFWFGLAGLILGVLIRFTAKPSGAA